MVTLSEFWIQIEDLYSKWWAQALICRLLYLVYRWITCRLSRMIMLLFSKNWFVSFLCWYLLLYDLGRKLGLWLLHLLQRNQMEHIRICSSMRWFKLLFILNVLAFLPITFLENFIPDVALLLHFLGYGASFKLHDLRVIFFPNPRLRCSKSLAEYSL